MTIIPKAKVIINKINASATDLLKNYGVISLLCAILIFLIIGIYFWGDKTQEVIQIPLSAIFKICAYFPIFCHFTVCH